MNSHLRDEGKIEGLNNHRMRLLFIAYQEYARFAVTETFTITTIYRHCKRHVLFNVEGSVGIVLARNAFLMANYPTSR